MLSPTFDAPKYGASRAARAWSAAAACGVRSGPSAQEIAMSPYKRNGPSGYPSRWATVILSPDLVSTTPPGL